MAINFNLNGVVEVVPKDQFYFLEIQSNSGTTDLDVSPTEIDKEIFLTVLHNSDVVIPIDTVGIPVGPIGPVDTRVKNFDVNVGINISID